MTLFAPARIPYIHILKGIWALNGDDESVMTFGIEAM
jgi:hypothetical protein